MIFPQVKAFIEAGVPYDLPADNGKTCKDMTQNEYTKKVINKAKKKKEKQKKADAKLKEKGEL